MNRKQRRAAVKEARKNGDTDLAEKTALFSSLPDHCLACTKPFDKTDRKQVMSWNVVVREEKKVVRLYCPDCWGKAQNVVKTIESEQGEVSED